MNAWILEMMKAMIDYNRHLAKKLTLFMNIKSFAPMLSLFLIDWAETWACKVIISIYLFLGCRKALWFKENLPQIWGRLLGDDKNGKTNSSHTKICQEAVNKSW